MKLMKKDNEIVKFVTFITETIIYPIQYTLGDICLFKID